MSKESEFQAKLIKKLEKLFKGCVILKNDPAYLQGICDLTVLFKKKWAMLECKESVDASHQPNQDYYVNKLDNMSFARFIYPENEQEVLDELQKAFRSRRKTRNSKC